MTDQNTFIIDELQRKANEGDAQAQYTLACSMIDDQDICIGWLTKSAEQGLVIAQLTLAILYSPEDSYYQNDEMDNDRDIHNASFEKYLHNQIECLEYPRSFSNYPKSFLFKMFVLRLFDEKKGNADLSFMWFTAAAKQNCSEAQYQLACCYLDGIGVQQSNSLALVWFNKAADQGHTEAQYQSALCYQQGKGVKQNNELAFAWFHKYAEQRVTKAQLDEAEKRITNVQYEVACCYLEGKGTTQSYQQAFAWFEVAAKQGNPADRICISIVPDEITHCYSGNSLIARHYQEAYAWYEETYELFDEAAKNGNLAYKKMRLYKALYQGHSKAKHWLEQQYLQFGDMDLDNEQFSQNDELAIVWLTKAAEKGDGEASFRLANRYLEGIGVHKNHELYIKWLIEAAISCNHATANEQLGNACLHLMFPYLALKSDTEQDYKFAFEWCVKEEANFHSNYYNADVYFCLAILYDQGKGVEKNNELAFKNFSEAERNIAPYQSNLLHLIFLYLFKYYKIKINHKLANAYFYNFNRYGGSPEISKIIKSGIIEENIPFLPLLSVELLTLNKNFKGAQQFINETFQAEDYWTENPTGRDLKRICLMFTEQAIEKDFIYKELQEKNRKLEEKEKELEDMMSMFAHKFRSPLDAIIYNTQHDNQVELYTEAAQTMRGLLNIFSIISTDTDILKDKIKQDSQGAGNLVTVFSKTLDMILLHLLSVSGAEKIQQHYLSYAKAQGQCDTQVSYKTWCEEYFELEQMMQTEWEASYAQLLKQSPTLEQRLAWLEKHFFKLEFIGFDRVDIQFKEYGTTESLLTILLNEILVNVFKYYSSESKQAVVLEWVEREGCQVLICCNPSIRSERTIIKGSHKGHVFLSTLARKTGSLFNKPIPQDDFVLEFGLPNELLISK